MKTVMKKMFSLLLVAVMLIGVMPFQAFADTYTATVHVVLDGVEKATFSANGGESNQLNVATLKNDAQVYLSTNEVTCEGLFGGSNEEYTETVNLTSSGWQLYARFVTTCNNCGQNHLQASCPDYCNDCLTQGHDESAQHCPNCDQYHALADCPTYCSRCEAAGHDDVNDHCTSCGVYGNNHKPDCDTLKCPNGCGAAKHEGNCCSTCGQNGHQASACPNCEICARNGIIVLKDPSHGHCSICEGLNGAHTNECDNNPHKVKTCTKCNRTYRDIDGVHVCCDRCKELHATADCPYCAVCWAKEDHVKTHKTADHCAECGKTDGSHKLGCSQRPDTGNALVRVHVRLHNGTTLVDTVELLTYRDDKGTQIGDSVSAHKSLIVAELAEEYPEYSWSGNLYDDPGDSQDYNELIGTGTTVYINAYAGQDMVLVYVHNSRSHSSLRIIQLEGKRRGDTVTKKEVTSAVSKYYNVSSLSMYSEDAWEDYVDGENVESVSSLKIPEDDSYYVIDVKISGTAKSGSGSGYTADSSNPKTGDTIFAPVAVMGLSVSALAVLLYLNKKRAF